MVAKIKTIFQVYDFDKDFIEILDLDDVDIKLNPGETLNIDNKIDGESFGYSIVNISHEVKIKTEKGTPIAFYTRFVSLKEL